MKSSVPAILGAVVLGAGLMFCITQLMKNGKDDPSGDRAGMSNNQYGSGRSLSGGPPSGPDQSPSLPHMRLVKGKRYRMMVVAARLPSRKPNGKHWDIRAGLPDCSFVLRTPENRYASSKIQDCLVPNWADKSMSIRDLWSGRVRVANEGAVFIYDPTSTSRIYLEFLDKDVLANDAIANLVFTMNDLRAGYTEYAMSYSTNSLSINTGSNRRTPDMVFTVRIIPEGR